MSSTVDPSGKCRVLNPTLQGERKRYRCALLYKRQYFLLSFELRSKADLHLDEIISQICY